MHAKAHNWSCQVLYIQAVEMMGGGGGGMGRIKKILSKHFSSKKIIDMCTIKWTKNKHYSEVQIYQSYNYCTRLCKNGQAVKNYILFRNLT